MRRSNLVCHPLGDAAQVLDGFPGISFVTPWATKQSRFYTKIISCRKPILSTYLLIRTTPSFILA